MRPELLPSTLFLTLLAGPLPAPAVGGLLPEIRLAGWSGLHRADRRVGSAREQRSAPLDQGVSVSVAWAIGAGGHAEPMVRDGRPPAEPWLDIDDDLQTFRFHGALDRTDAGDDARPTDSDGIDPDVPGRYRASTRAIRSAVPVPVDAAEVAARVAAVRRARLALERARSASAQRRARLDLDETRALLCLVAPRCVSGDGDR